MRSESINIRRTGISIPDFIKDEEIRVAEIKSIIPQYQWIVIETIREKKYNFNCGKI